MKFQSKRSVGNHIGQNIVFTETPPSMKGKKCIVRKVFNDEQIELNEQMEEYLKQECVTAEKEI